MISIERSLPINPPGSSIVSRSEVWKGLTLKADNALPFVPAMTHCKVLERETEHRFVREIELRGDRMKERVTLEPEKKVTFERIEGRVLGTIRNFIDEDAAGNLSLRFAFDLEVLGLEAGSQEEKDYAETMKKDYLGAVDATLAAIRKMHDEGAGQTRKSTEHPEWLTRYYRLVDAQYLAEFLDQHTPDARVIFGNNPAAVGHEQIGQAIGGLWSAIHGLRHDFGNVWHHGPSTILECNVTYARTDGKDVTVPCVSILETREGKVSELRVHIDLAPVFA